MSEHIAPRIPVVVVCLTGDKGGIDRVIEQWLNHSDDRAFDTTVIVRDVPGILTNTVSKKSTSIVRLNFPSGRPTVLSEARAALSIFKTLVRKGAAVLNLHDYYAIQAAFPAWLPVAGRTPIVSTVHMHTSWIPGEFRAKRVLAVSEGMLLKRSKALIAVSEDYSRRLVGLGFPENRVHVVHNGIDCDSYARASFDREEARAMFGASGNRLVFGFAGRFAVQKRPLELIRAVALLTPLERSRVLFLFAGKGDLRAQMDAAISDLQLKEAVKVVGHIDEIRRFYASLDVLVLSSSMEGLPMTLLEAMAQGIPALVTQVGGNAEIVRDPTEGWLMNDWEPETLATGIRRVIADRGDLPRRAQASRVRIESRFSVNRMVAETNSIYRRTWFERFPAA